MVIAEWPPLTGINVHWGLQYEVSKPQYVHMELLQACIRHNNNMFLNYFCIYAPSAVSLSHVCFHYEYAKLRVVLNFPLEHKCL